MNKVLKKKPRKKKGEEKKGGWRGVGRRKKREGEKSRGTYSPCVSNHFPFLFDFYIAGLKAFE